LADAFKAFGLVPEAELEVEEDYFLWPENARAFNLWMSVQTSWETDNGVRTGLRYRDVEVCIKYAEIKKKHRPWHFAVIQEMERAALGEWNKDR
jgi:hypothetical protein